MGETGRAETPPPIGNRAALRGYICSPWASQSVYGTFSGARCPMPKNDSPDGGCSVGSGNGPASYIIRRSSTSPLVVDLNDTLRLLRISIRTKGRDTPLTEERTVQERLCPNCDSRLPDEAANFCPNCGSELPGPDEAANFCTNCGSELPDESASFCPNCGAQQKPAATGEEPTQPPEETSPGPEGPSRGPQGPSRGPEGPSGRIEGPSGPSRGPSGPARGPSEPSRGPRGPSR